jgi:LytS/YehU family sensor histidine kinase
MFSMGIQPANLFGGIFYCLVLVLVFLLLRINRLLCQAEKYKFNAELSLLKAEINPHFLFNTLNNIYSFIIAKDDRAAQAVIDLAGFMRYIIRNAKEDKIPLQEELDYITHYVELQRYRTVNKAHIDFMLNGLPEDRKIAPLMVITFIENAFKYGLSPEEDSHVWIDIAIQGDELRLTTYNKKARRAFPEISSGIGIANTRNRLQLLYPGRHRLIIRDDDNSFLVNLIIRL